MKTFLIFLVIAALAVWGMYAAGWLSFDNEPDKTQINIHKDEAQKDTDEAIHKGKELLKDASESFSDTSSNGDENAPSKSDDDDESDPQAPGAPAERSPAKNPS